MARYRVDYRVSSYADFRSATDRSETNIQASSSSEARSIAEDIIKSKNPGKYFRILKVTES